MKFPPAALIGLVAAASSLSGLPSGEAAAFGFQQPSALSRGMTSSQVSSSALPMKTGVFQVLNFLDGGHNAVYKEEVERQKKQEEASNDWTEEQLADLEEQKEAVDRLVMGEATNDPIGEVLTEDEKWALITEEVDSAMEQLTGERRKILSGSKKKKEVEERDIDPPAVTFEEDHAKWLQIDHELPADTPAAHYIKVPKDEKDSVQPAEDSSLTDGFLTLSNRASSLREHVNGNKRDRRQAQDELSLSAYNKALVTTVGEMKDKTDEEILRYAAKHLALFALSTAKFPVAALESLVAAATDAQVRDFIMESAGVSADALREAFQLSSSISVRSLNSPLLEGGGGGKMVPAAGGKLVPLNGPNDVAVQSVLLALESVVLGANAFAQAAARSEPSERAAAHADDAASSLVKGSAALAALGGRKIKEGRSQLDDKFQLSQKIGRKIDEGRSQLDDIGRKIEEGRSHIDSLPKHITKRIEEGRSHLESFQLSDLPERISEKIEEGRAQLRSLQQLSSRLDSLQLPEHIIKKIDEGRFHLDGLHLPELPEQISQRIDEGRSHIDSLHLPGIAIPGMGRKGPPKKGIAKKSATIEAASAAVTAATTSAGEVVAAFATRHDPMYRDQLGILRAKFAYDLEDARQTLHAAMEAKAERQSVLEARLQKYHELKGATIEVPSAPVVVEEKRNMEAEMSAVSTEAATVVVEEKNAMEEDPFAFVVDSEHAVPEVAFDLAVPEGELSVPGAEASLAASMDEEKKASQEKPSSAKVDAFPTATDALERDIFNAEAELTAFEEELAQLHKEMKDMEAELSTVVTEASSMRTEEKAVTEPFFVEKESTPMRTEEMTVAKPSIEEEVATVAPLQKGKDLESLVQPGYSEDNRKTPSDGPTPFVLKEEDAVMNPAGWRERPSEAVAKIATAKEAAEAVLAELSETTGENDDTVMEPFSWGTDPAKIDVAKGSPHQVVAFAEKPAKAEELSKKVGKEEVDAMEPLLRQEAEAKSEVANKVFARKNAKALQPSETGGQNMVMDPISQQEAKAASNVVNKIFTARKTPVFQVDGKDVVSWEGAPSKVASKAGFLGIVQKAAQAKLHQ